MAAVARRAGILVAIKLGTLAVIKLGAAVSARGLFRLRLLRERAITVAKERAALRRITATAQRAAAAA